MSSTLILDLDITLRNVLQQPTIENIQSCFSLIQKCHYRRIEDEGIVEDDSLYIPSILILRQFHRFQNPSIFDELLRQFISLFKLIRISSKKILDDFLCIISIIFTKRIMTTNDEVQQDLFINFFQSFCLSIKRNLKFFYQDFLGDFNQNLPIIGHYLSCLLQLYEKVNTIDYRLNIINTIWTLIYVKQDEYRLIIGQILSCFLPGILKTFSHEMSSVHQRIIQSNLILLSYIIRLTVTLSPKVNQPIKDELKDLIIERNQQWLTIVDTHINPILQRFTKDYINHESIQVRRALGIFMLTILAFTSQWLESSSDIALKTMLVLINDKEQMILKSSLKKLFGFESDLLLPSHSIHEYENEFFEDIFSLNIKLSDKFLIHCQSDLFELLDKQSLILNDRKWNLQLFIGYYSFLNQNINYLFNLETFIEKLIRFILNSIDWNSFLKTNLNLLNESSLSDKNLNEYNSIYKYLKTDIHDEIEELIKLNIDLIDYLFQQIDLKKILNENNQKIFYLLSIIFKEKNLENEEQYQLLLSLLNQLISDDKKRKKTVQPISIRNLTIYFLLHILTHQSDYLIDFIPLLLLCHSSKYTIIHQTSLHCLTILTNDIPSFLVSQSEYIVDTSLKRLQTSTYDGYLTLIEFIRLGNKQVINLPIMTHVIEDLLLELSCLPSIQCIELTFEFLNIFCQQVIDIVEKKDSKISANSSQTKSLVDYAIDLQKEYIPSEEETQTKEEEEEQQHLWHKMLVSIVDVFQHFISHSNPHVRSYVLNAFPSLAHLLSKIDEKLFLPLVHKFWPGLIHRFYDVDINIRIRSIKIIECLCLICSDFVDRRIRQDILPIFIQQLEKNRFISSINTLEYRYIKYLLSNIGTILNSIRMNCEDIEKIILIIIQYLQNDSLALNAYEQLILLMTKYSDVIWLQLMLHDEYEYEKGYFNKMKVYKPQPMFTIDSKWKTNLLTSK